MRKLEIILALFGSLAASAIMIFLSDKQTFPAFVGWTIFFAAITFPTVFLKNSDLKCYFTKK
jgi:hypothetical protein